MRPTAHSRPGRRLTSVLIVAVAAGTVGLTGCAADPLDPFNTRAHAVARSQAADAARALYGGGDDTTIEDYARLADEQLARTNRVQVVGFEAYPDAPVGEPVGRLLFRSFVSGTWLGEDEYAACFSSEFDTRGVVDGEARGDRAVARDLDCPADAREIEPPVDTSTVYVVPEGTEAIVIEVLEAAPAEVSADEILALVSERMPQPSGEFEVAFDPAAVVVDGEIGFAMGSGGDCLLVKRTAAEGVVVVTAPSILLEPGELGCRPTTALLPAEDLRPPH